MTELEVLRSTLTKEAQSIPTRVQEAKESARSLLDELSKRLDETQKIAVEVATQAQQLAEIETLPVNYMGYVHNYRFGMINGKPMHRFDVEVRGTGLWLACTFTSGEFDTLLMTANPAIDLFEPEVMDGRVVTVKRDASLGRMVPLTFGATEAVAGPVLLKDFEGKDVRVGDKVSLKTGKNSFDRAFTAVVVGYIRGTKVLTVLPRKNMNTKDVKVKLLTRFVKLGEEPLAVGKAPVAKDNKGIDLFVGDIVRLYDESDIGLVAGSVLGFDSSPDFLRVARGDKKGPKDGWRVAPSSIVKISDPTPIAKDSAGTPLAPGDRVRCSGSVQFEGYFVRLYEADESAGGIVRDDGKSSRSGADQGLFYAYFKNLVKLG